MVIAKLDAIGRRCYPAVPARLNLRDIFSSMSDGAVVGAVSLAHLDHVPVFVLWRALKRREEGILASLDLVLRSEHRLLLVKQVLSIRTFGPK